MPCFYFAYPGDLDTPTGGYGYDRRILDGLRALGWRVELVPLGDGFPFPNAGTMTAAGDRLAALPDDALVVVDGLAYGVLGEAAAAHGDRLRLIALVHHPLCKENGLDEGSASALFRSEQAALQHVRHVIVTSPATAAQVRELFDVPSGRISTILPGTDKPEPYPRSSGELVKLLSVGTIVPRKGYDLLFEALAELDGPDAGWRLDIVGGLDADPACYETLLKQVSDLGLGARVTFHGAVPAERLPEFYRAAHVFVLASRYEGYGMAYTEALAHGLPVIGSGGGAVRDTLPEGAALYCGTENVGALRKALERLICHPQERAKFEKAARVAAQGLPNWQGAAAGFAEILKGAGK
ncbi:glycosyltransferase family 4 protein [Roseibium sediminicola]|uniref:Glycosyltransferase family 4 protein n=1 Tax=Roseibium sediminicola TaxID=2933272 RepID=A0ABT0H1R9_9HYPH|nr:glycosyltransferase family 4 protein [Roseibium sp. CAU 1639]MCK7615551.1 glycosyltransferase family 4 protein [Roseibium sp. CAU 1639]